MEQPHNEVFSAILAVSPVMERRFTRDEIELGVRVAFFSALASCSPEDLKEGEEVRLEWLDNWLPSQHFPNKLVRAEARIANQNPSGG